MKVIFFRWTKASAIQIIASVKHELQPEYYMTFDNNNKLSEHHSMSYFILRNERWAFFRFDLTLFDICAQFMPNSMKLNQLFVVPVDHFNQIWISTWLKLTLSDNKICLPVNAHENERRKKNTSYKFASLNPLWMFIKLRKNGLLMKSMSKRALWRWNRIWSSKLT